MTTTIQLTLWQKKQVALLHHFASLSYLKGLLQRVNDISAFIDGTLDTAAVQQRDRFLVDKRWGTRNTSENWANNAWPFLATFRLSIAKDIANRAFDIYNITGNYQCGRGMAEYSLQWTTPDEQELFDKKFAEISEYAGPIDNTMNKSVVAGRWHDFGLTLAWQRNRNEIAGLPTMRVRTDVQGETGKVPVRTGVYLPQDDSNGSPQFAWIGGSGGKLLECTSLNDLGRMALAQVGRDDLWLSDEKMFAFVQTNINDPRLRADPFFNYGSQDPALASNLVACNSVTSRPCKWYFVEIIGENFEDVPEEEKLVTDVAQRVGVRANASCPETGFYFSPSNQNSRRHFNRGDAMSDFESPYGDTIWQWDSDQKTELG